MRKQLVTALVGVGIALAVAPQVVKASLPPTACSSGALQVCAAVSASTYSVTTTSPVTTCTGHGHNQTCTTTNVTSTAWHLVLKVWNLYGSSGLSHVITYVGFGSQTYQGTGTLFQAKYNGNAISTWQTAKSINNNPVGAELDLAGQTKNGINNGVLGCNQAPPSANSSNYQTCYPAGAYLQLDFLTSAQVDLTDPTSVYGWHSQQLNGQDCSMWVSSDGHQTGALNSSGQDSNCGVVPEPVTMVLLGSGLAGMGGVGVLRRRKKDGDVESA